MKKETYTPEQLDTLVFRNLDMALAIRTMVVKDEKAYVQAGAGVVYDSDPVAEYEETLNKSESAIEVMK